MVNKGEMLRRLNKLLSKVIEEDNYQEMVDGVDQAIDVVESYFEEEENSGV